MNCFEEIRNRLDIRMVTERYGIEIKRNNTCLCPFHNDHHTSAYIYPNAFHCFTCNVHYDILGFVMELFGLSAIDAAKKLNDDFNLGIRFGHKKEYHKPKYSEAAEIREIKRKKRERFEKWEQEAYQTIHDYWWLVKEWYETLKPPKMDYVPENYQLDKRFVYALKHYSLAEKFSLGWIQQFSNEEKIEWKWVVDKMRNFLDEHKKEEKPQSTESAGTYIEISRTKSPDSIPVNW